MYSYTFIVCLLIPFFWFLSAWGTESSVSHSIPNSHLDEVSLNDDHPTSNREKEFCTVTLDGHLGCDEPSMNDQNKKESDYLCGRQAEHHGFSRG